MSLLWLPEARADVARLYRYLLEVSPPAAGRAVGTIRAGARRLLSHPEAGRRIDRVTERRELVLPFGGGAYILRYRLHRDQIVILRVWHNRETRL